MQESIPQNTQKTIALAGNPNVGKSTLFNLLTQSQQKIANYPGATVEKHTGTLSYGDSKPVTIIDLPGTYSLNTKTQDEEIAANTIQGKGIERPDIVVVVAEAAKLDRSLLLLGQIQKVHPQVLLVLNMMDELEKSRVQIDVSKLSQKLNVPVIPMTAHTGSGIQKLIYHIEHLEALPESANISLLSQNTSAFTDDYKKIDTLLNEVISTSPQNQTHKVNWTDRIDRVVLHPVLGPVVFLGFMFVVFQALFHWSEPFIQIIEMAVGSLSAFFQANIQTPWLSSLIADGVVAGVGSVVVFLPQIMILFFLIGILDMTGYLARGAFLIDRVMRFFGLEGRAFLPLMSSFACAIPGILATRTLPESRQRLITMLIAPLMTCSARLPVYTLLIATFIPAMPVFGPFDLQGVVLFGLFLAGIFGAALLALILNMALPRSNAKTTFFMELPKYRAPRMKMLFRYVWFRAKSFLVTAGTVIFVLSIILWSLAYFPRSESVTAEFDQKREQVSVLQISNDQKEVKLLELDNQEKGQLLENSFLGRFGKTVEPLILPMGFDWKIGTALMASFAAREVFVSTLGVVFHLGPTDEEEKSLRNMLLKARHPDGTSLYTLRTALSLMIFFVFAAQCLSTLAVIKKETNTWFWPVATFFYLNGLACILSYSVYQTLGWFGMA